MIKTRCKNECVFSWIDDLKKQEKITEDKNYIVKKINDWEEATDSISTFCYRDHTTRATGKYAIWEI